MCARGVCARACRCRKAYVFLHEFRNMCGAKGGYRGCGGGQSRGQGARAGRERAHAPALLWAGCVRPSNELYCLPIAAHLGGVCARIMQHKSKV